MLACAGLAPSDRRARVPVQPSPIDPTATALRPPAPRHWTRAEVRAFLALVAVALGLAAAAALAASLVWSPAEWEAGVPQTLLGIAAQPCPGCALCGLSRGFALVSRGHLAPAVALNPLVLAAYPAALALAGALSLALRALWTRRRSERCAS